MIPFAKPNLNGNEEVYVLDALRSGWISGVGPYVSRFEAALSQQIDTKHAVAVNNGTLALEVALMALGIGPGDEVIVPALTFAAPAAAVYRVGAQPVLADISPDTWTIDPVSVAECITDKTRAIIAVDLLGNPADFDELIKFKIPVIEDAAEAHGAVYKGRKCGSLGIVSTFSFHANKAITTGEGGAILTDWDHLAKKVRKIANHGMDHPYYHDMIGTNARPNNMMAALGLAQVENWDKHIDRRNEIRNQYIKELLGIVGFQPYVSATWITAVTTKRRGSMLAELQRNAIDARAIFVPLCDLPIYKRAAVLPDYPVARWVGANALMLPTFEAITDDEIKQVALVIRDQIPF